MMQEILKAIYSNDINTLSTLNKDTENIDKVYSYDNFEGTLLMHAVRSKNIDSVQLILNLRDENNQLAVPINAVVNDYAALDLIINEDLSIEANQYLVRLLQQYKAQTASEISQSTHDTIANKTALAAVQLLKNRYQEQTSQCDWAAELQNYRQNFTYVEYMAIRSALQRVSNDKTQFSHLEGMTIFEVMVLVWSAINDNTSLTQEQLKEFKAIEEQDQDKRKKYLDELIDSRKLSLFRNLCALQNEYGYQRETCPHGLVNGIIASLNMIYPNISVVDKSELDQLVINDINDCLHAELNQIQSLRTLLNLYADKIEENPSAGRESFCQSVAERFKSLIKTNYSPSVMTDIQACYNPFDDQFVATLSQFEFPQQHYKTLAYLSLLLNNANIVVDFLYNATDDNITLLETHVARVIDIATSLLLDHCLKHSDPRVIKCLEKEELEQCLRQNIERKSHFINYNGTINLISIFIGAVNTLTELRFEQYLSEIESDFEFIKTQAQLLELFKNIQLKHRCDRIYVVIKSKISLDLAHKILIINHLHAIDLKNEIIDEIISSDINDIAALQRFYEAHHELLSDVVISNLQARFEVHFNTYSFISFVESLPPKARIRICVNSNKEFMLRFLETEVGFGLLLSVIPPEDWNQLLGTYEELLVQLLLHLKVFDLAHVLNIINADNWEKLLNIFSERFNYNIADNVINFFTILTLVNPQYRLLLCKVTPNCDLENLINDKFKLCAFFALFTDAEFNDVLALLNQDSIRHLLFDNDALFIVLDNLSPAKQLCLLNYLGQEEVKSFTSDINKLASLHKRVNVIENNLFSLEEIVSKIKTIDALNKFLGVCTQEYKKAFIDQQGGVEYLKSLGGDVADICIILRDTMQVQQLTDLPGDYGNIEFICSQLTSVATYTKLLKSFDDNCKHDVYQQLGGIETILRLCKSAGDVVSILQAVQADDAGLIYTAIGGYDYIKSLPMDYHDLLLLLLIFTDHQKEIFYHDIGGIKQIEKMYQEAFKETNTSAFVVLLSLLPSTLLPQIFVDMDQSLLSKLIPDLSTFISLPRKIFVAYLEHLMKTGKITTCFNYDDQIPEDSLNTYVQAMEPTAESLIERRGYTHITVADVENIEVSYKFQASLVNIMRVMLNPFYLLFERAPEGLRLRLLENMGKEFVSSHLGTVTHCSMLLKGLPETERAQVFNLLTYPALLSLLGTDDSVGKIVTQMTQIFSDAMSYTSNYLRRERLLGLAQKVFGHHYVTLPLKMTNTFTSIAHEFSTIPCLSFVLSFTQSLPIQDWPNVLSLYHTNDRKVHFNTAFFKLLFMRSALTDGDLIQMLAALLNDPRLLDVRPNIVDAIDMGLISKLSSVDLRLQFFSLLNENELLTVLTNKQTLFGGDQTVSFIGVFIFMLAVENANHDSSTTEDNTAASPLLPQVLQWLFARLSPENLRLLFANSVDIIIIFNKLPSDFQAIGFTYFRSILCQAHREIIPHILRGFDGAEINKLLTMRVFEDYIADVSKLYKLSEVIPPESKIDFYNQIQIIQTDQLMALSFFFGMIANNGTESQAKLIARHFPYERLFGNQLNISSVITSLWMVDDAAISVVFSEMLKLVDNNILPTKENLHKLFQKFNQDEIRECIQQIKSTYPNKSTELDRLLVEMLYLYSKDDKKYYAVLSGISAKHIVYNSRRTEFYNIFICSEPEECIETLHVIFRVQSHLTLFDVNVIIAKLKHGKHKLDVNRVLNHIPYNHIDYSNPCANDFIELLRGQDAEGRLPLFRSIIQGCPDDCLLHLTGKNGDVFHGLNQILNDVSDTTRHAYIMLIKEEILPRLLSSIPSITQLYPETFKRNQSESETSNVALGLFLRLLKQRNLTLPADPSCEAAILCNATTVTEASVSSCASVNNPPSHTSSLDSCHAAFFNSTTVRAASHEPRTQQELSELTTTLLAQYKISVISGIAPDLGKLLRMTAVNGNLSGLRQCCEVLGIDINKQDENPTVNRTALHWAVINGHINIVQYLISKGADTAIMDAHNKTPLAYAVEHASKSTELLEALRPRIASHPVSDAAYANATMTHDSKSYSR